MALLGRRLMRSENVDGNGDNEVEEKDKGDNVNIKKKKRKNKKNKKKAKETLENEENTVDDSSNGKEEIEEEPFDEDEYYAWNELGLHHLIMKSMYQLGFKEPNANTESLYSRCCSSREGFEKMRAFGLPHFATVVGGKRKGREDV
ncbi:hypothetical protein Pyn_41219 [Prunus yedoensis var. nudiflora]|uniref:Uncharacterized protein n=1 Tax=Prunus yedoensis var. nudiflora TaxID=2094558 RepID=A0A314UGI6_PRUYE|nr:hypothetical protein Pyn_41219 [Prunus yedoensis var. nudiflora]